MAQVQTVVIDNLGGGVNSKRSAEGIGPSQMLPSSRNIRLDGDRKLPRNGYTTFADTLSGGTQVRGYGENIRGGADPEVIKAYNGKLFSIDPKNESTWDEILNTSLAVTMEDVNTNFVSARNWTFVYNGVNRPGKYGDDPIVFTAPFTGGEISGFLSSSWAFETGAYTAYFSNGEEREINLTNGATPVTWADPLSGAATDTVTVILFRADSFIKPDSIADDFDFTPKFGAYFVNSQFVAGVPSQPNVVFISKPSTSADPDLIYDFSGTINEGSADELIFDSEVIGMKVMPSALVIFTRRTAYFFTGFKTVGTKILPDYSEIGGADGLANTRACATVENDVYFLTPKKEIKSARRSASDSILVQTQPISLNIKKFLQEELDEDQSSSFAYYDQEEKLFKLFVKSKGSAINDLRIVADIKALNREGVPEWLVDDAMNFNAGIFIDDTAYIGSSALGQTYVDEDGLADDDDVNIATSIVSKKFTANNPTTEKTYRSVRVHGTYTIDSEFFVDILVDGSVVKTTTITGESQITQTQGGTGTQTTGDFTVGSDDISREEEFEFTEIINFRKTGKRLQVIIRSDGINNKYKLNRLEYDFIAKSRMFNKVGEKS